VVSGYKIEDGELRSIRLFGMRDAPLAPLTLDRERVLVYTSDLRFAQHVGYHFDDMLDPSSHVGWTMFAALSSGTVLDLVRFDSKGQYLDDRQVVIDVAYMEEGTEDDLVRLRPITKDEPIQSPEPTAPSGRGSS
jgi:hypothetical protein